MVDGEAVVTPVPDLGAAREYAVDGKTALDGEWGIRNGDSRFFRIRVALPRVGGYTISFDGAGGSAVAPVSGSFGSVVVPPDPPTRTGYTFAGWSPALPATMPADDLTVVAQWTPNRYVVHFEANGGTGSMDDQEFALTDE